MDRRYPSTFFFTNAFSIGEGVESVSYIKRYRQHQTPIPQLILKPFPNSLDHVNHRPMGSEYSKILPVPFKLNIHKTEGRRGIVTNHHSSPPRCKDKVPFSMKYHVRNLPARHCPDYGGKSAQVSISHRHSVSTSTPPLNS